MDGSINEWGDGWVEEWGGRWVGGWLSGQVDAQQHRRGGGWKDESIPLHLSFLVFTPEASPVTLPRVLSPYGEPCDRPGVPPRGRGITSQGPHTRPAGRVPFVPHTQAPSVGTDTSLHACAFCDPSPLAQASERKGSEGADRTRRQLGRASVLWTEGPRPPCNPYLEVQAQPDAPGRRSGQMSHESEAPRWASRPCTNRHARSAPCTS